MTSRRERVAAGATRKSIRKPRDVERDLVDGLVRRDVEGFAVVAAERAVRYVAASETNDAANRLIGRRDDADLVDLTRVAQIEVARAVDGHAVARGIGEARAGRCDRAVARHSETLKRWTIVGRGEVEPCAVG